MKYNVEGLIGLYTNIIGKLNVECKAEDIGLLFAYLRKCGEYASTSDLAPALGFLEANIKPLEFITTQLITLYGKKEKVDIGKSEIDLYTELTRNYITNIARFDGRKY